ncbi:nitrate reductase associated protein [Hyella patelloides]|nr:nitrate reductase associated protein [Hyella patelloides]
MTNQAFLQFETDFVESLRCIPMIARMKLDTCGVKLKLEHWNQFTQSERQTIVTMPCNSSQEIKDYREFLQNLVIAKTGKPAKELAIDPHPLWLNTNEIPKGIKIKAAELGIKISLHQWSSLTSLQRFALIKLSRPSHENRNFMPALKEFGIAE